MEQEIALVEAEPPECRESSDPADEEPPGSSTYPLTCRKRPAASTHSPETKARLSRRSGEFLRRCFRGVTPECWNDWRWQVAKRFRDPEGIGRVLRLSPEERDALGGRGDLLPFGITPYYASLLDPDDPGQPLRKSVVPSRAEFNLSPGELTDPLAEDADSPVPGLVHRYPDRVLFLVTEFCSTYCRYCTRSRIVGRHAPCEPGPDRWEAALRYIARHPEIRDVLLSGGDPLTLPDDRLNDLLRRLRQIPHVEIIRLGTKVPAVLPQRITRDLVRVLRRYHPLYLSLHFTHPDELTPETARACRRLANAGIPLGSQTVLLAGVNDDPDTMRRLMQGLLRVRVRPYYLYQCDPIPGSAHFRTPTARGLEIIRGLRGHTSGYAVPTYVVDAPGGGGKIPLLPDYVERRGDGELVLRNYRGDRFTYPDVCDAG